jgi:3alpha(or 20beta)-hydroxysteroid dehydrogenase
VTVLFNNAGILGPIVETVELSEEEYLRVCAINQHAQFYGMKCVIPSMQKAGGGSIINVSSIAGIVSIVGSPNLAYVGSKFASRGMTKHVAVRYGQGQHPGQFRASGLHQDTDDGGGDRRGGWRHLAAGAAWPYGRD